ncbi:ketopantoate reductase family protein [Halobacterium yunchengense]|uniref:ketopantoate reductase family protein n=1 Tax=Halobacterium yunchengense TaxID=3108497 RepID=UPI00300B2B70
MHVVVLGAGAIGSLVAGSLAAADEGAAAGASVTLLGRDGEHERRVRERGLRFERPDGSETTVDVAATSDRAAAARADLLVVCVKSYDTAEALAGVAPHLDDAEVLTLQNGLGNAETVAERVPDERVVVGTTSHGAVLEGPGHLRHAGRGDTTVGRWFAANDDRVRETAALLSAAGIETAVTDDPERAVWAKVLVNLGVNAPTALARVRNGALVDEPAGRRLLEGAVAEGVAVAEVCGVDAPEDAVERTRTVARRTATNRSSMRQDLEAGGRTEVEALYGEVARRAAAHDVDAPVTRTLADLLRLAESE